MLRKPPVSTRFVCLASALCVVLNATLPAYPQEPSPPPPQSAPAPQPPPVKQEKPPATGAEQPAADETEAANPKQPAPYGATLKGKLTTSDRSTPLSGARVHVIAKDRTVFTSSPADDKGRYSLPGIPPGTYRVAVSTEEGIYSLESEVGISSANAYTVDLAVIPAEAARGTVPGLELEPRGFAAIVQGKKKGGGASFWGSAKGITLLAVSAGAVALILTQSDNGDEAQPVSPSLP